MPGRWVFQPRIYGGAAERAEKYFSILKHDNFPSLNQAKLLLNQGEGQFLWNSLTITGIIEARGRALAEIEAPNFQDIIVEDMPYAALEVANKKKALLFSYPWESEFCEHRLVTTIHRVPDWMAISSCRSLRGYGHA